MLNMKENIVTIYLDQNITTRIDSDPQLENLREILQQKLGENIFTYYSQAHISDITSKSIDLTDYVKKDLKNLSDYTLNNFMHMRNGKIHISKRSPLELFETTISSKPTNYSNLDDLVTCFENIPEASDIMSSALNIFESLPLSKDMISNFEKLSIKIPENGSFKDLINGLIANQIPMMTTELYRDQRDLIQNNLGINSDGLANSNKPFKDIEKSFVKQGMDNNNEVLYFHGSDFSPKNFTEILNHYIYLDMHGFNQDKIVVNNPKKRDETFTNTSNDAQHTAYASYCKYYITKDKKNTRKAKATYNKLKIPTIVINPDEDFQKLNDLIQFIGLNS